MRLKIQYQVPSKIALSQGDWDRFINFMLSEKMPSTKQLLWMGRHIYGMPENGQKRIFHSPDFSNLKPLRLETTQVLPSSLATSARASALLKALERNEILKRGAK